MHFFAFTLPAVSDREPIIGVTSDVEIDLNKTTLDDSVLERINHADAAFLIHPNAADLEDIFARHKRGEFKCSTLTVVYSEEVVEFLQGRSELFETIDWPEFCACRITGDLMAHPVQLGDGNWYDKESLKRYLNGRYRAPHPNPAADSPTIFTGDIRVSGKQQRKIATWVRENLGPTAYADYWRAAQKTISLVDGAWKDERRELKQFYRDRSAALHKAQQYVSDARAEQTELLPIISDHFAAGEVDEALRKMSNHCEILNPQCHEITDWAFKHSRNDDERAIFLAQKTQLKDIIRHYEDMQMQAFTDIPEGASAAADGRLDGGSSPAASADEVVSGVQDNPGDLAGAASSAADAAAPAVDAAAITGQEDGAAAPSSAADAAAPAVDAATIAGQEGGAGVPSLADVAVVTAGDQAVAAAAAVPPPLPPSDTSGAETAATVRIDYSSEAESLPPTAPAGGLFDDDIFAGLDPVVAGLPADVTLGSGDVGAALADDGSRTPLQASQDGPLGAGDGQTGVSPVGLSAWGYFSSYEDSPGGEQHHRSSYPGDGDAAESAAASSAAGSSHRASELSHDGASGAAAGEGDSVSRLSLPAEGDEASAAVGGTQLSGNRHRLLRRPERKRKGGADNASAAAVGETSATSSSSRAGGAANTGDDGLARPPVCKRSRP